jgi:tight adherence protein C
VTALALGVAWTGFVLVAAWRHRPAPARARVLLPATSRRRPDLLGALGRAVLWVAARGHPAGATPARSPHAVGAVTVAVAAAAAVALPLAAAVALAAWALPRQRARTAERRRVQRLESALPETVDLLVLAVGAGCNVPLAVAAAGRRGSGPMAAELRRVAGEVARGRRLADALDELPDVAGEPTRPLAGVLARCERYGTPALPALRRLADEVRIQRQRRAEAAARRVPVTLLFPLVVCILPAFALLTMAPLVAGALRELRL